ncbi:MAG TPA: MaoC/PaaZ C-terminal domain-containing protein [Bryobacteraceae bacterium]|nr:MaoC/PaaZ C-terminal domain-containing protein [Bryobacteraceae bacterium]
MSQPISVEQTFPETIVTEYLHIAQERIDSFAAVTEDGQWIHTDPARAAAESPFQATVAHGFLTLALLPRLLRGHLEDRGCRARVNYGFNRVRFLSPVRVNSRIRARIRLLRSIELKNGVERTWDVTVECENARLPACVAEWVVRYYS